jgi:hypothetical protein
MVRTVAASWQYCRPAGVVFCFQVCEDSIEPRLLYRVCNLLAKDDCRLMLLDEPEESGPQVALVCEASASTLPDVSD